jgi:hypothetical protein
MLDKDIFQNDLDHSERHEMKSFTSSQHRHALLRRRIKFVVEKGAMARLFRAGKNRALQEELFKCLQPAELALIRTQEQYDLWLIRTIESDRWKEFSRNGIGLDRWSYFAKLLNIVIYEVISNRELFSDSNWKRLRPFLHIPLDATVTEYLSSLDPNFPKIRKLKGMTKKAYLEFQVASRRLGTKYQVPPIWFEAAWSSQ